MTSGEISDCVVLLGPDLEPWRCRRLRWQQDTLTAVERVAPVTSIDDGAWVVLPGLINGHTHVGDACWPDGATSLTLEEGFFRPDGFKYRELARIDPEEQLRRMVAQLHYMARSGTVLHLDFREQGAAGAELLRRASALTGVDSVILSQFNHSPFTAAELEENRAPLPPAARTELTALLAAADGFSESTMNDLTDAAWREIRRATDAAGKWRAIHCLENAGYRELSLRRTGHGDLTRALELLAPHLVVHLTAANESEIAQLAHAGTTAAVNPRANASLGLPLPPLPQLLRAGVNLLLGTDNGLLNSANLFAELDFTYKVARSQGGDVLQPHPSDILRMVTSNLPSWLGADRSGWLEEGRPATFTVVDFHQSHLRHSRHVQASLVTRVTPEDVIATYRLGRELHGTPRFAAGLSRGTTARADPPLA